MCLSAGIDGWEILLQCVMDPWSEGYCKRLQLVCLKMLLCLKYVDRNVLNITIKSD